MNNNNNTYKPLGDYIRKIDKRNRDLSLTKPMGINIDKQFMPSVANVIGTDMSNYKLVEKNQFACNLMHVGRDGKIPVAINKEDEMILVSPAYHVFEIVDENILSHDFLMMWFHREEFDREASFYTDADVRSGMDFKALMEMRIPVPPISEQRAVVADYEAVARRISVAKRTIATLQATAQTLYRKMFVDGIDKENLPEGWRWGKLGEVCEKTFGGDWGKDCPIDNYKSEVLCIRGTDIPRASIGQKNDIPIRYILPKNLESRKLREGNIVIEISGGSPVQSTGRSFYVSSEFLEYIKKDMICSNFCRIIYAYEKFQVYVYASIKYMYDNDVFFKLENSSNGVKNLDLDSLLNEEKLILPNEKSVEQFSTQYKTLVQYINIQGKEIEKLTEIQSLLLARMGK